VSQTNPTFAEIAALLDTLINNDPNISSAPHATFWRNTTRDKFVQIQTDTWGAPGALITLGQPEKSNLYLALAGLPPFDSFPPQMPDTDSAPNARHATTSELKMVSTWITNNCPA
jgi:hypothetical protein